MEQVDSSIPSVSCKAAHISFSDIARSRPSDGGDFAATLLAMAGHDLRQPLQLITSAHEVLATMLRGQEQRNELARAQDATAQLAGMLNQLIEALQLHERPRQNLHAPVLLRPVLDDLMVEFGEPAHRKGITFRVTTARGTALSHPILLTSILRNLVRNAIDYTPPGGQLFVASRRCGLELRIEVRDTGVGIRAGALGTIFDAFQRTDDSRVDGLGLGLFIVKRASDLLDHRIEVQSVEGCGSRFTVVVPVACCHTTKPDQIRSARCSVRPLAMPAFHFRDVSFRPARQAPG